MGRIRYLLICGLSAFLVACGGGGGSAGAVSGGSSTNTVTTIVTGSATVASLSIRSSLNQVKSDGSTTTTIVVNAIDANNGLLRGAVVTINASSGVLSSSSGTTDANGQIAVTFAAGTGDVTNRVATITATSANGRTAQTQVNILGGSLTIDSGGINALLVSGAPATVSVTVRDVSGASVTAGVPVAFASSNPSAVSISAVTALTNSSGVAVVSATGLASGNSSITASANGITSALNFSVTASGSGFYFSSPSNGSVVTTGTAQMLTVVANGAANVTFATTLGTFSNGLQIQNVTVVGGLASASISSVAGGSANISAFDPANTMRSVAIQLVVTPPVSSANKLLITAARNNISVSTGGTLNSIQISARGLFNSGGVDVGVFNVPILFTFSGGPGAGEYISQAVAFTDASGNVSTTFVAGNQSSTQNGIRVKAQILGSAVSTGVLPSNSDLILTIGGQALSVIFTAGTTIIDSADSTYYELPFSALVTDANGSAVGNTVVSLSLKPYAFSTGSNACAGPLGGTYCSEDLNGNGSLDSGEDGARILLPNNLSSTSCSGPITFGTVNNLLTPPNSAAGSIPGTVTTGSNGIAAFKLTYLKGSATWIVVKLTATVGSVGSESTFSTIFRLVPSAPDATAIPCPLPVSPYTF